MMKYLEMQPIQKTNSWTLRMNFYFCHAFISTYFVLKIYTLVHYVSKYMCIFFKIKRENLNFDHFKFSLHGGRAPLSFFFFAVGTIKHFRAQHPEIGCGQQIATTNKNPLAINIYRPLCNPS